MVEQSMPSGQEINRIHSPQTPTFEVQHRHMVEMRHQQHTMWLKFLPRDIKALRKDTLKRMERASIPHAEKILQVFEESSPQRFEINDKRFSPYISGLNNEVLHALQKIGPNAALGLERLLIIGVEKIQIPTVQETQAVDVITYLGTLSEEDFHNSLDVLGQYNFVGVRTIFGEDDFGNFSLSAELQAWITMSKTRQLPHDLENSLQAFKKIREIIPNLSNITSDIAILLTFPKAFPDIYQVTQALPVEVREQFGLQDIQRLLQLEQIGLLHPLAKLLTESESNQDNSLLAKDILSMLQVASIDPSRIRARLLEYSQGLPVPIQHMYQNALDTYYFAKNPLISEGILTLNLQEKNITTEDLVQVLIAGSERYRFKAPLENGLLILVEAKKRNLTQLEQATLIFTLTNQELLSGPSNIESLAPLVAKLTSYLQEGNPNNFLFTQLLHNLPLGNIDMDDFRQNAVELQKVFSNDILISKLAHIREALHDFPNPYNLPLMQAYRNYIAAQNIEAADTVWQEIENINGHLHPAVQLNKFTEEERLQLQQSTEANELAEQLETDLIALYKPDITSLLPQVERLGRDNFLLLSGVAADLEKLGNNQFNEINPLSLADRLTRARHILRNTLSTLPYEIMLAAIQMDQIFERSAYLVYHHATEAITSASSHTRLDQGSSSIIQSMTDFLAISGIDIRQVPYFHTIQTNANIDSEALLLTLTFLLDQERHNWQNITNIYTTSLTQLIVHKNDIPLEEAKRQVEENFLTNFYKTTDAFPIRQQLEALRDILVADTTHNISSHTRELIQIIQANHANDLPNTIQSRLNSGNLENNPLVTAGRLWQTNPSIHSLIRSRGYYPKFFSSSPDFPILILIDRNGNIVDDPLSALATIPGIPKAMINFTRETTRGG